MRRLLILLALTLPAAAQTGAAFEAPADDRRPPLFVLADGDSQVYLLGSVHALPGSAFPLPPHVEAAYARAAAVAFELDLDAAQAGAMGMIAAATDEATTADLLSPIQHDSLRTALGALGLPAATFDAFEPWFAAMSYGVLAIAQTGLDMEAGGVDGHLFRRAAADGKERLAFETMELQTAAFDDLPEAAQVAFLMRSVSAPPDSLVLGFERLIDAWAGGDDDGLAALMNDELAQPELFQSLLVRRNRAWIPQIEALLARDADALVVVGAGHLVGPQSVVEMLREAGHTVERR